MVRKNKKYIDFIKEQPCCVTGGEAVPHHVRTLGECGTGLKPPDYFAIPIDPIMHIEELHRHGEELFYSNQFIDPAKVIIGLLTKYIEETT